jgi:selenocysteine lyase/cysteine desulfurase
VLALRWHAAQEGLLSHNRALTAAIIERADAAGLTLATPRAVEQRGGSIMLQLPTESTPTTIVEKLREARIHVDARGQILRLSPGAVTRMDHVHRLFDRLETLI